MSHIRSKSCLKNLSCHPWRSKRLPRLSPLDDSYYNMQCIGQVYTSEMNLLVSPMSSVPIEHIGRFSFASQLQLLSGVIV